MRKSSLLVLAAAMLLSAPGAFAAAVDSVTTTLPSADANVNAGTTISYTFKVQNTNATAGGASLSIPVPANTTFVSSTPDAAWTLSGSAGANPTVYTIASLPSGGSGTFIFVVKVNQATPATTTIPFAPSVTPTGGTLVTAATRTMTVVSAPITYVINFTAPVANSNVNAGTNVTYTFTVQNSTALPTGSSLSVPLPAGTTLVSSSTADVNWTQTSGVGVTPVVFTANSMAASSTSGVFTIVVQVIQSQAAGSVITLSPTVTATTPNTGSANATRSVNVVSAPITYAINFTAPVANSNVNAGTNVTYTFTVQNSTALPTGSSLSVPLPAGTTLVSSSTADVNWTRTSGVGVTPVVFSTNSMAASSTSGVFTIVVQVNQSQAAGSVITLSPTVTATTPNTGSANATRSVNVVSAPITYAINFTAPVANSNVNAGTNVTYTFTVQNSTALPTGSSLSVPLPAGTTLVSSSTGDVNWTRTSGVGVTPVVFSTNSMAASSTSGVFTIVVQVIQSQAAGSVITLSPTVTATTPNTGSANATRSVNVVSGAITYAVNFTAPAPGSNVNAGTNVTYTFNVQNTSATLPSGSALSVALTPNSTLVSSNTSDVNWTQTSAVGVTPVTFTTASMAANSTSGVFTIVVKVNQNAAAGSTVALTPTVSATTPNTGSATSALPVNVVSGAITYAVNFTAPVANSNVNAGVNVTYTFNVQNTSTLPSGSALSVPLPANSTLVSSSTADVNWTQTSGAGITPVTFTSASMAALSISGQFTIVVKVNQNAAAGAVVTLSPTVSATTPNTGSATASRSVNVIAAAITYTVTIPTPAEAAVFKAGQVIPYTLFVKNTSLTAPSGSLLTINIPTGTSLSSITPDASWTLTSTANVGQTTPITYTGTLAANTASGTFSVNLLIDQAAAVGNIAFTPTVAATTPNSGSAQATRNITVSSAAIVYSLAITNPSSDGTSVNAGTQISYFFNCTNTSAVPSGTMMSIPIPAGTTFSSVTNADTLNWKRQDSVAQGQTGTIIYTNASQAAGNTSSNFVLAVIVDPAHPVTNTGTVPPTNAVVFSPTVSATTPNTGSTTASRSVNVQSAPISYTVTTVTPAADGTVVHAGDPITYAFNVKNNSNVNSGSQVSIPIPTNTTLVSAAATDPGWTLNSAANSGQTTPVTFFNPTFAKGSTSLNFNVVVQVNSNAPAGNISFAPSCFATTPNTGFTTATARLVTVQSVGITYVETITTPAADGTAAFPGNQFTYVFNVKNTSGFKSGTTVDMPIPVGTTLFSVNNSDPNWVVQTAPVVGQTSDVIYNISSLAAGATSADFTLVVVLNSNLAVGVNNLSFTPTVAATTPNTGSANATRLASVTAAAVLYSVAVTTPADDNSSAVAGTPLTYVFNVKNIGAFSSGTSLSIPIPVGTSFQSITPDPAWTLSGTLASNPLVYTINSFKSGSTGNFSLTVKVNPSTPVGTQNLSFTTTVTAIAPNTGSASTTRLVSTTVVSDLAITLVPSAGFVSPITAGTQTSYTLNVVNNGPSDAVNVVLTVPTPPNTTFTSFAQTAGAPVLTFGGTPLPDPGTAGNIVSDPATVPLGNSLAFTLVVKVNSSAISGSTITANAQIGTTPAGNDTNAGNNSATDNTFMVNTVSDIFFNSVNQSTNVVIAGNNLIYTCVVSNAGPSDALNASFSLPLPAGTTFVSAVIPAGWTPTLPTAGTNGTVSATNAAFAPGSLISFIITCRVDPAFNGNSASTTVTLTPVPGTGAEVATANNTSFQSVAVLPQPTVSISDVAVTEGDSGTVNAVFTVTLSSPNTQLVSVDFATADGSAQAPGKYITQTGTLIYFPNDLVKTISVAVVGNTIVDGNTNFFVNLSNPANTTFTNTFGTGTILDDDKAGSVQFSSASYTFNENAGTAALTIVRTGGLADGVSVTYTTSDVSAVAGSDYTATTGTATFKGGQNSLVVTVPLLNRYGAIPSAQFNVSLSNPKGGSSIGSPNTAVVTLLAAPAFTSATQFSAQIGAPVAFLLTATGEPTVKFSVSDLTTLPPGLFFSADLGYITGTPRVIGSFVVPLIALNSVGSDLQNLTIVITAMPGVPGLPASSLDSDGDGFPDTLEIMAGSDPFNANSTPVGNKSAVLQTLSAVKLAVNLNFSKGNSDSLMLSGTVVLPPDFQNSGKLVYVDVGGVIRRFALDADGKNKIGSDSIAFKFHNGVSADGTTTGAATGTFVLVIKGASARDLLAQTGLTNDNLVKVPRTVPLYILLNSTLNTIQQPQVYTAKKNRSGKSKNP